MADGLSMHDAAIHEAGHAVIGAILGGTVTRVMIEDTGDGHTGLTVFKRQPAEPENRAITAHAGWKAELLVAGQLKDRGERVSDLTEAYNALACVGRQSENPKCMQRAADLVVEHIRLIESIASAIEARGEIDGAEVHAAVVRAYP